MEEVRDDKGRFKKGYSSENMPIEDKIKRMYSLQESWRNRKDYIGDIKQIHPYIFNTWRGIMYTKKGKNIGVSDEWKSFRNFFNDVSPTYKKGYVFRRLDTSKIYSKDNFIWIMKQEAYLLKSDLVTIEYNGETLHLKQWADKLNLSLYGIKSRYYKRDKYNYTTQEILFGRTRKRGSKIIKNPTESNLRSKASKMISSYKIKDKKNRAPISDITIDWMIENIINKPCIYCGDTNRIGCDRIDNSKGHTIDNVVPCCYECNCARNNNFSFEEMKILGESIRKIKNARKDQ